MASGKYIKIGERGFSDVYIKPEGVADTSTISLKNKYGFELIGQTNIQCAKPKEREVLSYIERDGEEIGTIAIDPANLMTVKEAFDYYVEFMVFSNSLTSEDIDDMDIPTRISKFTNMFDTFANNRFILWNTYKGQKMIGYYKSLEMTTDDRQKYDNIKDFKTFKVTFRIDKPNQCVYDLNNFYESEIGV